MNQLELEIRKLGKDTTTHLTSQLNQLEFDKLNERYYRLMCQNQFIGEILDTNTTNLKLIKKLLDLYQKDLGIEELVGKKRSRDEEVLKQPIYPKIIPLKRNQIYKGDDYDLSLRALKN